MQKFRFFLLLTALGVGFASQPAVAVDPTPWPGAGAAENLTASTIPAESVSSTGSTPQRAPAEAGETPKFYTITAELRETYDDNVYTSNTDKVSSFETSLSPSILVNFPMENSQYSSRLTVGITNYENEPNDPTDLTADFLARFTHQFSDRFAIDVRDETGYFTEPGLFSNVGTLYRDGSYISSTFSADFTAQWTPLISTDTSYSNAIIYYDNSTIAAGEDSINNTLSQNIGFAILPKYTLDFTGSYSGISYNDDANRGYNSFTGSTGINWEALPTLTTSVNVGASYTQADESGNAPSPYVAASLAWQLGQRSHLSLGYTYSVVPTDVTTASGQLASRTNASFSYDINRSFSTYLNLSVTYSDYTVGLVQPGTTGSFTEWDSAADLGVNYHISDHFGALVGYTFSDVSSQINFRDYTRNQIYFGLSGSY